MTGKIVHVRLWGDDANCSEAEERRLMKKIAKMAEVEPKQVEIERMTAGRVETMLFVEKKGKRGGVDGGTGKTEEVE